MATSATVVPGATPAPLASITLADGRSLSYDRLGDPAGTPVMVMHGWGDSRLARPNDAPTAATGADMVFVDRPGAGQSSPHPERTLLSWADDVTALAGHLGWTRFAVIGWSGGGPHALACAWRLQDRISRVVLVACAPPLSDHPELLRHVHPKFRILTSLAKLDRELAVRLMTLTVEGYRRDPERAFARQFVGMLGPSDRRALADPDIRAAVMASMSDAVAHGIEGYICEGELLALRPWGFRPSQLAVPVSLWQGVGDRLIRPTATWWLAGQLPANTVTTMADEGHWLYYRAFARIVADAIGGDHRR